MLTFLVYLLMAVLVFFGLTTLLIPVYLWILCRDAVTAPQRAAEMAEREELLAEIEAMRKKPRPKTWV